MPCAIRSRSRGGHRALSNARLSQPHPQILLQLINLGQGRFGRKLLAVQKEGAPGVQVRGRAGPYGTGLAVSLNVAV